MTQIDWDRLRAEAGKVFNPSGPIDEKDLFAGRKQQVGKVIDVINQRGQHGIIYGERGVGKTSLANVLAPWLESLGDFVLAPRVNCDGTDNFATMWRKMFAEIQITRSVRAPGFSGKDEPQTTTLADQLDDKTITPDDIRKTLLPYAKGSALVLIFDEFDKLTKKNVQSLFADTIKCLSDHSVPSTIILLGVADSIDQLIAEHESVGRALVQIHMRRMSKEELEEIVNKGIGRLGMTIEPVALNHITLLSQGLPHYTHLLGLHASREAIEQHQLDIQMAHIESALKKAVEEAQQSIHGGYHKATTSARKDNLYSAVLLACALADTDDFGYFAAADIREPLNRITGGEYDIPSFSQHLRNFCDDSRGPILHRAGVKHRFRFRFKNPLMQPFVIMRGMSDSRITASALEKKTTH
ncbi:MAG: ATP-binding protein [bacterium]